MWVVVFGLMVLIAKKGDLGRPFLWFIARFTGEGRLDLQKEISKGGGGGGSELVD